MGAIRSIAAIAPPTIARIDTVSLNGWALLFAVIALTGTTVALGVVPVMLAKRSGVGVLLRTNSTSVVSHRRVARLGQALVGIEVAMTLALLVIAGTMARSALRLQNVPLGYDTEDVFSAHVSLSQTRYREVPARQQFYHDLLEELRRDPAVVAAGAVLLRPLEGQIGWDMHYVLPGQSEAEAARNPTVNFEVITPGYFAAIGTPLIAGRQFADHEDVSRPQVTIVSEAVARRMYGSPEAALGKQFRFGIAMTGPMVTIVGVVADARYRHLTHDEGDAFVPYRQSALPTRYIVVRTRGDAEGAARLVRRAVAAVDPAQSISREATIAAIVSRASVRERFNSLMLLLFAAVSIALTAAGVYGVVTTVVARRHRELGLRRALGAKGADVVRLVLRSTLSAVAVGEIVGLLGGVRATLAVREMLFDVSPVDPLAIVGGTVTVLMIASAACMPAVIRAVATEPMRVLGRGDAA